MLSTGGDTYKRLYAVFQIFNSFMDVCSTAGIFFPQILKLTFFFLFIYLLEDYIKSVLVGTFYQVFI